MDTGWLRIQQDLVGPGRLGASPLNRFERSRDPFDKKGPFTDWPSVGFPSAETLSASESKVGRWGALFRARADLTDSARQIIREAAEHSTRVQYTRIEVNGCTDTSGTPAYNQRLSVRRAQNVAAELVRNGVPRNAISIHGLGQTHLLVPTGDGVREPQNRRVEIIIH